MSQCQQLERYLRAGHQLTPLNALRLFGVMALSQRMTDLRRSGVKVRSELIRLRNGKRIARYELAR